MLSLACNVILHMCALFLIYFSLTKYKPVLTVQQLIEQYVCLKENLINIP